MSCSLLAHRGRTGAAAAWQPRRVEEASGGGGGSALGVRGRTRAGAGHVVARARLPRQRRARPDPRELLKVLLRVRPNLRQCGAVQNRGSEVTRRGLPCGCGAHLCRVARADEAGDGFHVLWSISGVSCQALRQKKSKRLGRTFAGPGGNVRVHRCSSIDVAALNHLWTSFAIFPPQKVD